MTRIIATTITLLATITGTASASTYPSQALAESTMRSWIVSKPGPCGNGATRTCKGDDGPPSCFGTVGTNALYCYGSYEEGLNYNPFKTYFCSYGYPTRVGKVSEGVARVVFFGGDNCGHGAFYP
jgi:hypothetical protein